MAENVEFMDAVDWQDRDSKREMKVDGLVKELEQVTRRLSRLEREIRDLRRKIEGWEREEERLRLREKREKLEKERKIREKKELKERVWIEEQERARARAELGKE